MSTSIVICSYHGPREEIRELFELAEDSALQLDQYIWQGDVLVVVGNGGIAGHIQLVRHGESGIEIKNMAVLPNRQGRGLGRELVEAAADFARHKECSLMVVGHRDS